MTPVNVFWFRRDLRLHDNAALYHALRNANPVLPIFIFDTNILNNLDEKADARVQFIHDTISKIQDELAEMDSAIQVYYDTPIDAFKKLLKEYRVEKVFTNHDYEPYATGRDEQIVGLLQEQGASFHTYKDQVIFDKGEVLKDDGNPYTVFTPYSRKWRSLLTNFYLRGYPTEKFFNNFYKQSSKPILSLASMGFKISSIKIPPAEVHTSLLKEYGATRDFPALEGTSRLGIHLRFGTISIRELVRKAQTASEVFLNELIWREFYQMILWHFPPVGKGKSFKPAYDFIQWRDNEEDFEKWCQGKTGYPMVDAGMRQLNETGFMHNRVRMITASFLAKHLLIDWRWGEAYFAEKLLDYDLAANNGNWQWAAGCGCDAAPYFRIFNPTLQAKKFDPKGEYIRKWITEIDELTYPQPMVDHEMARKRCLDAYDKALKLKQY
jgi:deoxyribodipyrimidine photo-lyase